MSRLRRPLTLIAAAAVVAALSGCSTTVPGATTPGGAEAATRVVVTDKGDVSVPVEPERIVVLNSNLAGYFYALDVPVFATIPEVPGPGGGDYPASWAEQATDDETVILPWGEDGFDFEAILAAEPDLIVGGGQGFAAFHAGDGYERLSEIAPTVLVSNTLLSWQDQLSFIAEELLDEADAEAGLLAEYDAKVAEVSAAITLPPTPVGYLVTTADGVPYSLPETSALPQTLAELGFTPASVIADNPDFEVYGTGDSFELSTEQVSQVLTAPTLFVFGFNGNGADVATAAADPVYAALPAFAGGHAYDLPSWAYRADFLRTMELLDHIQAEFS